MIWWRKDLLETLGAGLASTAWIHTQSRTTAYMHSMITMMNCPYHHVRQNIMVGRDGTTLARPTLPPATGALRVATRNQRRVAPAPARVSGSSKASPLNAACAPRLAVDQDERKQEAAASSHVAGVYSAARYQHPNLFPNPPEFDGSNVELYHHTMVEYNDIVCAKRHTTRTKDSNIWVKVPYQLASCVRLKLIADTYLRVPSGNGALQRRITQVQRRHRSAQPARATVRWWLPTPAVAASPTTAHQRLLCQPATRRAGSVN